MIKRLIVVALTGAMLAGCSNTDTLSGDTYSASEAKQVQSVSYGTLVSVRPVKIRVETTATSLGPLAVPYWVDSWVIPSAVVQDVAWQQREARCWVALQVRAYKAQ